MPRAAKDAKVEAPNEIEKLRQWLRVRCPRALPARSLRHTRLSACFARCATQSTYDGQDLPEADKWRALQRTRSGESSKSRGAVDLFYCTPDEPPKCVARLVCGKTSEKRKP